MTAAQTDLQSLLQVISKVDEVRAQKSAPTPEQQRQQMAERVRAVYQEQGICVDEATINEALDKAGYSLVPVKPVFPPSRSLKEGGSIVLDAREECGEEQILFPTGEGGPSLVEFLLVVMTAVTLAIAAFVIFPRVQAANQANHMLSEVSAIYAGTRQLYMAPIPSGIRYDKLSAEVLSQARVFPSDMQFQGGVATNGFGGVVTARPLGKEQFVLTYTSVPSGVCRRVAEASENMEVRVNGRAIPTASPGAALKACSVSDTNTMEFVGQ